MSPNQGGRAKIKRAETEAPTPAPSKQRRIIGAKPRPRALIIGFDQQPIPQLQQLFPTYQVIESLAEVCQEEWDLVVTSRDPQGMAPIHSTSMPAPHLYVLAFGGRHDAYSKGRDWEATFSVQCGSPTLAREFEIASDLPVGVEQLLAADLLPWVQSQPRNSAFSFEFIQGSHPLAQFYSPRPLVRSFLQTTTQEILAGAFRRSGNRADTWLLPTPVLDVVSWTRAAISYWHTIDNKSFPFDLGWRRDERWFTPAELLVRRELDAIEVERKKILAELSNREQHLEQRLADVVRAADGLERVLLTGQGDLLVGVVEKALQAFGFHVENMDAKQPANDRREDLRVTIPDDPEWVALVEVRGYRGGAQVSDLMRLNRFHRRFHADTGHEPSACWYVVNQFLGADPSGRQKPLGGNPSEVHEFAADGGLVIDTRDLFVLWNSLRSGVLIPGDARAMLREARGVFERKPRE